MRLRRLDENWFYREPFWIELERAGLDATVVDVPISFSTRRTKGSRYQTGESTTLCPSPLTGLAWHATSHAASANIRWATKSPSRSPRASSGVCATALSPAPGRKPNSRAGFLEPAPGTFLDGAGRGPSRRTHAWPVESVGDAVPPHALREVYRAVDDALGVILDALDPSDTTTIISRLTSECLQRLSDSAIVDQVNYKFYRTSKRRRGRPEPRTA